MKISSAPATSKAPSKDSDIQQRLNNVLKGAFAGPPTPLKAIPKKREESRAKKAVKKPVGK